MQFRTKARAVDLLGKGQIADLPTAISELWKNGYDAYADNLNSVLYTQGYEDVTSPFLTIADDGKGMSRSDIQNKWLILGTDFKSRDTKIEKGEETLWKAPRPVMGEKGIGRLSVSYLGSPMLMLSKKKGHPLQALYFDWRILENYNLFLEDVVIPLASIDKKEDFLTELKLLKEEFLSNFYSDDKEEQKRKDELWVDQIDLKKSIVQSTGSIELPNFFREELVEPLLGDKENIHGTKFIIFEPDEQFQLLKNWSDKRNNADDEDIETVEDIRTGLVGFYNEFKYKVEDAPISTSFLIKDKTGSRDFISSNAFFSNDDFDNCDHLIDGKVDEYGTFTGNIRIYNETISDYKYRPNKPANQKTSYGSFKIKLGYVPGKNQSILEDEVFKYYDDKLRSFGGLYIYRDDLRVLPYGRPNNDFLQFEERRSKSAGFYFFSYRRMFGYIGLTRQKNWKLKDKAGREGFINNSAFRDFKIHLQGLFLDLAKEYFQTDANQPIKKSQLEKLKDLKASEKEEQELVKKERKKFKQYLQNLPEKLKSIKKELSDVSSSLDQTLNSAEVPYQNIKAEFRKIDQLIAEFRNTKPQEPKRFKMNSREREKFEKLEELYDDFGKNLEDVDSLRTNALGRIEEGKLLEEYRNKFESYKDLLSEITENSKQNLKKAFDHIDKEFISTQNSYSEMLFEVYENNLPKKVSRKNIQDSLFNLETAFNDLRRKYQNLLDAKSDHLLRMNFEIDDDALIGFYKDRYEKALQELGDFKDLAQLGIAVEIINHELNSMYSQLNTSISEISTYLKDSKDARKHFKYLKNSFEHLDTKYQSLNPLYRRSRRTKRYISGDEIKEYLNNFFEESFRDEKIKFTTTQSFLDSQIFSFESVILPVFVNVINNAIYWLRSQEKPEIVIDYADGLMIISNNGPKIKDSRLEEIFELFYTRRPKGRGIGLYLSKDNLRTVGLDIKATNDSNFNRLNGATFLIGKNLND
ncbi:ATP-binding protein [Salegentibacter chungangensis]|uniref:ATP-binding protein n=1 Tax=Salegentibacter chungangensis TaxID=1335724 RepID=A0ABW3NP93_9FLAO